MQQAEAVEGARAGLQQGRDQPVGTPAQPEPGPRRTHGAGHASYAWRWSCVAGVSPVRATCLATQSDGFEGGPNSELSELNGYFTGRATALVDVTFPTEDNPTNLKILMKADKPGAEAKILEL